MALSYASYVTKYYIMRGCGRRSCSNRHFKAIAFFKAITKL